MTSPPCPTRTSDTQPRGVLLHFIYIHESMLCRNRDQERRQRSAKHGGASGGQSMNRQCGTEIGDRDGGAKQRDEQTEEAVRSREEKEAVP